MAQAQDPAVLLRESLEHLNRFILALSDREWTFRPREGWSIPECCEHVLLLEKTLAERLPQLPEGEPMDASAAAEVEERILAATPVATTKVSAPEAFLPAGRVTDRAAFLEEFSAVREKVIGMAESDPGHWLRVRANHIVFGVISGRHRLLTLALHLERHLKQMEDVRRQAG